VQKFCDSTKSTLIGGHSGTVLFEDPDVVSRRDRALHLRYNARRSPILDDDCAGIEY
jgi:hypothetical protein